MSQSVPLDTPLLDLQIRPCQIVKVHHYSSIILRKSCKSLLDQLNILHFLCLHIYTLAYTLYILHANMSMTVYYLLSTVHDVTLYIPYNPSLEAVSYYYPVCCQSYSPIFCTDSVGGSCSSLIQQVYKGTITMYISVHIHNIPLFILLMFYNIGLPSPLGLVYAT